jgi:hypothetical protein
MKTAKISSKKLMFSSSATSILALSLPATALAANVCDKVDNSAKFTRCVQTNPIIKDLQTIINALGIGVGIVVVVMIIWGGIQYMTAGNSPESTAQAKQRIMNALIALFAFLLTFAFIQWLIPGGIFG